MNAYRRISVWVAAGLLAAAGATHLGGASTWSDGFLVAAAIAGGVLIVRDAGVALRYRQFSIELLVSIAVIGALIIGEYVEAGVVSFLFLAGRALEARTGASTRSALTQLLRSAPRDAEIRREGADHSETVSADDVLPGDTVLIRSGSVIPVDGTVTVGQGWVNQAALTGEPVAVDVAVGDQVMSGSILDRGYVEVTALSSSRESTFATIVELVETAQESTTRVEAFLDRFARIYTPAIMAGALVTYFVTMDIELALTLLVIACPGALVIAAPVTFVAGLGNLARHGVLVKGGTVLESFATVATLAFDKTGTLTAGTPRVTDVITADGSDADDIIRYAAALEELSEHPLAAAVVAEKTRRDTHNPHHSTWTVSQMDVLRGRGVTGVVDTGSHRRRVAVGQRSLVTSGHAAPPPELDQGADKAASQGATIVWVAVDGQPVGIVAIRDTIRPEVRDMVAELRAEGVAHTVVLSGDHPQAVAGVARDAGIDIFRGSLMPQDKAVVVEELAHTPGGVAMVGDGINDAPALVTATVGVALSSGTDVSVEAADIVLVSGGLGRLGYARRVARSTRRVLHTNIALALVTVGLLVAGVLVGRVDMAGGMLIHEASVLAVVLNALRLVRMSPRHTNSKRPGGAAPQGAAPPTGQSSNDTSRTAPLSADNAIAA